MARYAVIHNGTVENVIEWDGLPPWAPPGGTVAVPGDAASPGDTYDGARFTTPPPAPLDHAVAIAQLNAQRADLAQRIVQLGGKPL